MKVESIYKYILGLLVILSILIKLLIVSEYSTYTDEILSAIVASNIAETGIPLLPSGALYTRAPLYHYFLAIPMEIGGINFFTMRSLSIVFSGMTIILTYFLAKIFISRKYAVCVSIVLIMSTTFNQTSLSGRMYMTYTFFFILTIYYFYKGFIENDNLLKILCIISFVFAVLCSESGLILGPIIFVLLYIYKKWELITDKHVVLGLLIWLSLAYLILFYHIPGSYDPFTAHAGVKQYNYISLDLPLKENLINILYPLVNLDKNFPFTLPFLVTMAAFLLLKGINEIDYPILCLFTLIIFYSLFTYRVQHRIMVTLYPLYLVSLFSCLYKVKQKFIAYGFNITSLVQMFKKNRLVIFFTITVFIVFFSGVIYAAKIYSINEAYLYLDRAFGYHDKRKYDNPEKTYNYLKNRLNKTDVIIQTTLEYGYYFLGKNREYYYLRQKRIDEKNGAKMFTEFKKTRDPYYGVPIIDSVEKLHKLVKNSKFNVYIIADSKIDVYVGPRMKNYIKDKFNKKYGGHSDNTFTLYSYPKLIFNSLRKN